ncbi:hypothetical protein ACIQM3_04020 [Streptomyces sp. NPDC091271]|uniref:hypothetical protein n=1 Tax=Streptomyces sp. NPDC091271 TaxID=3365980 RepID=UPI00382097A4
MNDQPQLELPAPEKIPATFVGEAGPEDEAFTRAGDLRVRASQINKLTSKQYQEIRQRLIDLGLPDEIASTTPWLAADPQAMIDELKRLRHEVLVPGVTGITLYIDVMMAALVRAPENLRMTHKRYSGSFELPQYQTTPANTALTFDLRARGSLDDTARFLFTELDKVDAEIDANNKYGSDIVVNGVRIGGLLFPLLVGLPEQPWLGGWETADCYGRTYFIQEAEKITASQVLEWLRVVPTDARELRLHPLQQRRAELLSISGKVLAGNTTLSEAEERMLLRAVMPRTKLVLRVDGLLPMDEVRRRLVAQQHLDRPTPFSVDTEWQTRAEAVLHALHMKGKLAVPPGVEASRVKSWLDKPQAAISEGECHADDIAAIGMASLLHIPGNSADCVIGAALKTRGVTGTLRTHARPELTAQVIARAIADDSARDSRRSALERALQMTELRSLQVDMRPIGELLESARNELGDAVEARSKGQKLDLGSCIAQIAARAAFHLTCGTGNKGPLLQRSPHGAGKGESQEPAEILRRLASSKDGLEQLGQAIYDGRRGFPVRVVPEGQRAEDRSDLCLDEYQLTKTGLRDLALSQKIEIEDPTASALVAEDTDRVNDRVRELGTLVEDMSQHKDDKEELAYVEDRGWHDPHKTIPALKKITERLEDWETLHRVLNRDRRPAVDAQ